MTTVTEALWVGAAVLLGVALMLATFRLLVGPAVLDRLVTLDTISALGQCALGLYMVWTRDTTPAPAVMALALLSFLGPVAVARFRAPVKQGLGS